MKRKFPFRSHLLMAAIGAAALGAPALTLAATFTVNSVTDAADSNVGDGICDDGTGLCTLRAAIQEANANPGLDTVDLSQINDPNSPITLTINGVDETWQATASGAAPFTVVDTPDASKGDLDITDSIQIVGAGSDKTVIQWSAASKTDGDPSTGDRVFQALATTANITVDISGLTIRNGSVGIPNSTDPANPYNIQVNSDGSIWQFKRFGGAIALGPGAAVALYTPSTQGGGGDGGNPGGEGESGFAIESATLSDVVMVDNSSGADGGGLYNAAPLTLEKAVIWGNTAGSNGGGIYNDAAMTMADSSIGTISTAPNSTANTAENGGGLFDTGAHTTDIIRSAINGNTATGGGAIAGRSLVRIDIVNSTVDGNSAADVGGGILTNGTVSLLNATISDNVSGSDASFGGAGLNSFGGGTFLLKNTIVADNASGAGASNCGCTGGACTGGQFVSQGHNLENTDSCSLSATGDLPGTDPQLKALANNGGLSDTRALPSIRAGDSTTSPAIDTGTDTGCPNNDQRESLRPADGDLNGTAHCDIGAFELFIPTADLQISDIVAPDSVAKNTAASVAITVLNADQTNTANNVSLTTSALATDVTIDSASYTVGSTTSNCTIANQIIDCAIGALTPGQSATVNLSLTPTAAGERSLTATVTSTTTDSNTANNTASANILVTGSADLSLKGAIDDASIDVGTTATGHFTVTNNGPDAASGPRFVGTVSGDITVTSITSSKGLCRSTSDGYLCELDALAPGESATIDVSGKINTVNTVTFTGQVFADPDNDPVDTNNTVSFTVTSFHNDGGGCAFDPGAPFDPTLPALTLLGLGGLILRHRRRQQ